MHSRNVRQTCVFFSFFLSSVYQLKKLPKCCVYTIHAYERTRIIGIKWVDRYRPVLRARMNVSTNGKQMRCEDEECILWPFYFLCTLFKCKFKAITYKPLHARVRFVFLFFVFLIFFQSQYNWRVRCFCTKCKYE